ncbi:MAG: CBS domain-containing protein [Planctomycetes bacterium]|nr:CBS domain-containing protein [Planctomycetota bacterium]
MNPHPIVLTAAAILQRPVFTLSPEQEVLEAVQQLLHHGISGAPVVVGNKVVGMFSERDCMAIVASAAYDDEPSGYVQDHMRTTFDAIGPDTDLFSLTMLFQDSPARRIPVITQDGTLVGVVTRFDLMRGLQQIHRARVDAERKPARTPYERVAEFMASH